MQKLFVFLISFPCIHKAHHSLQVFMKRLQRREEDENDKLIPPGSVGILLSNIEDLYAVSCFALMVAYEINSLP